MIYGKGLNDMLGFIIGFILGGLSGIMIIGILIVGKDDRKW